MLDHVFTDAISALREAFEGAFLERQAFEEHFQVDVLLGDVTWETSYGLPGEGQPPRVVAHITFDWPTWSQTSTAAGTSTRCSTSRPRIEMEIVFRVQRLATQPDPERVLAVLPEPSPLIGNERARARRRHRSRSRYDDDLARDRRVRRSRSPTRACTSWPRRRWPTARAAARRALRRARRLDRLDARAPRRPQLNFLPADEDDAVA